MNKILLYVFLLILITNHSSMGGTKTKESGKMTEKNNEKELHFDKYGGWRKKQFEATGFFYPIKDGKKWWFVTPEGNAFLSFGINHYHAGWFSSSHNKVHWEKVFGGPADSEIWRDGLKKRISEDFESFGFNTLGIHNDRFLYGIKPYLAVYEPVNFSHYIYDLSPASYVDIFSPDYVIRCRKLAKKVAGPLVNDPMLLGYQMADCPVLTDNEMQQLGKGYTWPLRLRNLGGKAPGKRAYVAKMKELYKSIRGFNRTYKTNFANWSELTNAEDWRTKVSMSNKRELSDNEAFNLVCIDKYYSVAKEELEKVDSNHLFFGDKINANTEQLEKILDITTKYTDVVFYQMFGTCDLQEKVIKRVMSLTDQPMFNGDNSIAGPPNKNQPHPCGPTASSRKKQSDMCKRIVEMSFSYPHVIGWHRCGIIDTWTTTPGKKSMQHQGVYDVCGEEYLIGRTLKNLSQKMYDIHLSDENNK